MDDDANFCDCETDSFECDNHREGCVLGDECLMPDPFHLSSECFNTQMAEDWSKENDSNATILRDYRSLRRAVSDVLHSIDDVECPIEILLAKTEYLRGFMASTEERSNV